MSNLSVVQPLLLFYFLPRNVERSRARRGLRASVAESSFLLADQWLFLPKSLIYARSLVPLSASDLQSDSLQSFGRVALRLRQEHGLLITTYC